MNKSVKHKKKKSNWSMSLLFWGMAFLITALIILYLFTLNGFTLVGALSARNYWLLVGVSVGLELILYLMLYRIDAQNIALGENDLEDTEWLTTKKLKKLKEFNVTDFEKIGNSEDGVVIGAEKKGKGVEIISTVQLHSLIVGTTGSGKTSGFIDQNIAILSSCKTKPSLLITDPKRELYEKHTKSLMQRGYKICTLDLREPYTSARWNPFGVLIRRIKMIKELENNLQIVNGKYCANGETFLSYSDAKTRRQELYDEIYENAMDLVYTICPIKNKEQPTWEEGARNLIFGFVLAMCEDCIKGKLKESQLILFNLYHNITSHCSEDTSVLKEYLIENRDEFSKVKGLVNTVLITSDKTLTSYLSEVNSYMQQLADDGILSLTSENELELTTLDEAPTAIFVIVPDERFTRHRFVTLFITQMYKEMVEKANLNLRKKQTSSAILKRPAYFILDEFGNLPKFENIEGMVTVARSRGIRFLFALQSFSQLNAKYGKEIGDIVKTNCNVKIFIGTDDSDTKKEFSELCGNKKIKHFSVNTSAENPASSSTGATSQPLITVGMLERINGNEKGDAIVSVRGYEPIWTKFTPSYLLKDVYFLGGKLDEAKREAVLFDKAKYVFNIAPTSQKVDEDMCINAIEEMEKEESRKEERLKKLDEEWLEVNSEIEKIVNNIAMLLIGKDSKKLLSLSLEGISTFLYNNMEQYNQSIAQKMQQAADKISL